MHVNSYSYKDSNSVREAYIFLHGFPGQFTKNDDLAATLAAKMKADSFVPHFSGIGQSPGEFLFTQCIFEARELLEQIRSTNRYEKINVVAHSWGAFVAIQLITDLSFRLHKLILLAPLTFIPPREVLNADFETFISNQSNTGRPAELDRLLSDYEDIRKRFSARTASPNFSEWPRTLVIQGNADLVTPLEMNRPYFNNRDKHVSYVEVEDNHWLTDRAIINNLVLSFLKEA